MEKSVVVFAGNHGDGAAPAAVAAAGSAPRYKFLAPESETAVAAIARLHLNSYFIDKHLEEKKKGRAVSTGGPLIF